MNPASLRSLAKGLAAGALAGALFWLRWSGELTYEVYQDGVFVCREHYTPLGEVLISCLVGGGVTAILSGLSLWRTWRASRSESA
ncbi:MAG TPA: hypothetical protein DEA08_05865 [Planctomycetes bacterium]|nr:hypothetical protein [Planctomycetota bacterium]